MVYDLQTHRAAAAVAAAAAPSCYNKTRNRKNIYTFRSESCDFNKALYLEIRGDYWAAKSVIIFSFCIKCSKAHSH